MQSNSLIEESNRIDRELEQQVVYQGFTRAELKAAFDAVCNPADWKAPIGAWVRGEAVMLTVAAIQFFTATQPRVRLDTLTMRYLIESEGYRMGPAGDH